VHERGGSAREKEQEQEEQQAAATTGLALVSVFHGETIAPGAMRVNGFRGRESGDIIEILTKCDPAPFGRTWPAKKGQEVNVSIMSPILKVNVPANNEPSVLGPLFDSKE
jgi:hypothetical protein